MKQARAGVTLIEMLLVVTIIALVAAIAFPSVSAGLEGLRLTTASTSIVSFLNSGLNRAERRQEGVEISVSIEHNRLEMRSTTPGFSRTLEMPDSVRIQRIYPAVPGLEEEKSRAFLLYPGGNVPRLGVQIGNSKGLGRIVRVDPTTGVPQVERISPPEPEK